MNRFTRIVLAAVFGMVSIVTPARARDAAPAASNGGQGLQAIFIEVEGKARWRADDKADWKDAVVNDLVSPGAEIRTGLKGRAALRVGKNATVLVDAGTTFQLPTIVQDGETLRTLAAVKSGRVDFKVDKVGFANDFKVLTPQTTLSVRGTGFGVSTGPLAGVEVVGARTNMINAIELRYVTQNVGYFLSGSATSSSARKDPVKNAWLSTIGPPQVAGTIADNSQLEQTAAQGQTGNAPTSSQMAQQIAAAQTEQQFGSSVLDLLRLEERAADRSNALTGRVIPAATAVRVGDELERQWGDPGVGQNERLVDGASDRLAELRSQADDDLVAVANHRSDLDAAILDGSENEVTAALDAIAAVDDAWHDTLRVEAGNIVASLTALNAQIQTAYALLESQESSFNALMPPARQELVLDEALHDTLNGLRDAVRRYQAAITVAVRAGQVNAASIAQLLRSVEILREVERRTDAALAASASVADLLGGASSLSERVLLAAAYTAHIRGTVIKSLADGLKADIDKKASDIELARFDAFYRSAEAGLDAIEEGSALAIAEADAIIPIAAQVPGKAAEAKPLLETALQSADAMNTFWTDAPRGSASKQARMQELQDRSATDRAQMTSDLANLQVSIGSDDAPGAGLYIDQMKTNHDAWWTPDTGLVDEARGINDEMAFRMATVEQDWQTADSKYDEVQTLLDSAEARRAAATVAATKIADIKSRLERYNAQYLALAADGRGGASASAQVQASIDALTALETTYQAGLQASTDAATRAATATSNAERTLYTAASNAYLRSLGQAGDSAAAMAVIETNAAQILADYNTGRTAYDGKFPPGK